MAAFVGSSKGKHRKTSLIVQSKVALPSKDFIEPGDDVILTLNVGGEVFQTYQRTLGKKFRTLLPLIFGHPPPIRPLLFSATFYK